MAECPRRKSRVTPSHARCAPTMDLVSDGDGEPFRFPEPMVGRPTARLSRRVGRRVPLAGTSDVVVGAVGIQLPLCTHGTSGTLERMTQMPIESIRDVRAHLAEVVERADRDDQPTVITRRGKEVAAVVSIDVLRKYQQWEEREINRIIDERMANRSAGVPIEDVMKETLARSD